MTDAVRNMYLEGNYAPVPDEVTAFDLPVVGEIPAELEGRYLRNGPNPLRSPDPATHHWFTGDGMVHGVRLRGGRAEWYRNRYVGSTSLQSFRGEPDIPGRNWNDATAMLISGRGGVQIMGDWAKGEFLKAGKGRHNGDFQNHSFPH